MVLLQQLHVKNNKAQKGELRMKRFFTHFMRILLCIVLCYDAYILIPGVKDGVNGFFENIAENISDFKEEIRSFFSTAETESAESASSSESKEITFNPVMNAYYEMLDDNQKKLYAQMYKTAETAESSFTPFSDTVNQEDVDTAFHAMCYDHPELFWMDGQYSVSYYEESGKIISVQLEYSDLANDLDQAKKDFDDGVSQIVSGALAQQTDLDKERYVHDTLISLLDYSLSSDLNQSAYSAFVTHQTVCAGYAKAFQYCMTQLGIPCYYVTGVSENQDHAWNIVYIDGVYRNVDVTWDDTSGFSNLFYNLTDAQLEDTHTRSGMSVNLPSCS
jgi:transglutaminase/protease-like cytokinesis protein 3